MQSLVGSAGAAFAGSTCAMAAVREKDDYKNWAFGGAVAGSIFGIKGLTLIYTVFTLWIYTVVFHCLLHEILNHMKSRKINNFNNFTTMCFLNHLQF